MLINQIEAVQAEIEYQQKLISPVKYHVVGVNNKGIVESSLGVPMSFIDACDLRDKMQHDHDEFYGPLEIAYRVWRKYEVRKYTGETNA